MGRIKSYPFTRILYLGLTDEVPEFNDDTLVVVVPADDERAGKSAHLTMIKDSETGADILVEGPLS